jgi:hypothetical protein
LRRQDGDDATRVRARQNRLKTALFVSPSH